MGRAQCTPASHAVFIPSFFAAAAAAADRSMKVISAFQRENANKFSLIASCAKDRETKRRGREREGGRLVKAAVLYYKIWEGKGRKEGGRHFSNTFYELDLMAKLTTSS